jgi:hypothetical protein
MRGMGLARYRQELDGDGYHLTTRVHRIVTWGNENTPGCSLSRMEESYGNNTFAYTHGGWRNPPCPSFVKGGNPNTPFHKGDRAQRGEILTCYGRNENIRSQYFMRILEGREHAVLLSGVLRRCSAHQGERWKEGRRRVIR